MAISNHMYQVPNSSTFETIEDDSMDKFDEWHRSAMEEIEMSRHSI